MEETECGAACLDMVLAHYGRVVPLEDVREACAVSRDGSKASNMLKAARAYGLEAKGYRRPFERLAEGELLPQILFWRYSHWVVLEGYRKGSLLINDPAEGRRRIDEQEARRAYSGIALYMEPGADFVRGQPAELDPRAHPPDQARAARLHAGGHRRNLPGDPRRAAADVHDPVRQRHLLLPKAADAQQLLTAVAVVALLIGLLTLVQQWFLARLQTRLTVAGSFRFVDHLLHLPVQYFTARFPGVVVGRLDQIDTINQLIAGPLITSGVSAVGLVIYAAVMFVYSPLLTAIAIAASLINVAALVFVSKQRDSANQLQLRESARLTGLGMSTVSSIESIKTSGSEDSAYERWAGFQARYVPGQPADGTADQRTVGGANDAVEPDHSSGAGHRRPPGDGRPAVAGPARRLPVAGGVVPDAHQPARQPGDPGPDGAGADRADQ